MVGCFLRYENSSFYNQTVVDGDTKVCGSEKSSQSQTFFQNTQQLINELSSEAPGNGRFSMGSTQGPFTKIYDVAQCWKTLSKSLCRDYLLNASDKILACSASLEGRALNTGCYMHYTTLPFALNQTCELAPSVDKNGSKLPIVLGTIIPTVLLVLFGVILSATRNFNLANKLGEGGFGSMHKMWRHFWEEMIESMINSNLEEFKEKEEVLRVVQVALLCTQAYATLRPPMSNVVQMLTNKNQKLPVPTEPSFLDLTNPKTKSPDQLPSFALN
eukprot:Gb_28788 [translate_table: standard]